MRLTEQLEDGKLCVKLKGHYSTGNPHLLRIPLKTGSWEKDWLYNLVREETQWLDLFGETKYGIGNCSVCGQRVYLELRDDVLEAQSECPYPYGYPAFTVELDVPSGRIAIANDFRELVTLPLGEDDYDVNVQSEKARLTQDYAKVGMVHVYVGNTCPGIYRKNSKTVSIGKRKGRPAGKRIGFVCTDLWWFSAMDAELFERCCSEQNYKPEDFSPDYVEVEPGLWSWTVDYAQSIHAQHVLYSKATHIGPSVGFVPPANTFSDPQSIHESLFWKEWQQSYAKYKHSIFPCMGAWLEHCFCVLGSGMGWTSGQLTHQEKDKPFVHTLTDAMIGQWEGSDEFLLVPTIPNAETLMGSPTSKVYPMADNNYGGMYLGPVAARVPFDVDSYWLAAGLIFFKTLVANPELLNHEHADLSKQISICQQIGNLYCTIAEERGLWLRLHSIYAEFIEHAFPVMTYTKGSYDIHS